MTGKMYKLFIPIILLLQGVLLPGCEAPSGSPLHKTAHSGRGVEVIKTNEGFLLYRNGAPYFIEGVSGAEHWEIAASHGGNTVRTYHTYKLDSLLNLATRLNLTVAVGLELPKMRNKNIYNQSEQAEEARKKVVETINNYKDHPAVLCWVLGNEVNLLHESDKEYWEWTETTIQAIHKADSTHPVMVCVNEMRKNYEMVAEYAPSLDILGVNVFGNIEEMNMNLASEDTWSGPIIIAEWSPLGYWEASRTEWNAPIEESDARKGALFEWYYETYLKNPGPRLLGSMAFYWGQKQERTHTWFSIFSEKGEKTTIVDALSKVWEGPEPANHAPVIGAIYFHEMEPSPNIYLTQHDTIVVQAFPDDVDADSLTLSWELFHEGDYMNSTGGDVEKKPQSLDLSIMVDGNWAWFEVPEKVGPYRLFSYVSDGKGGFGVHNIPFFVIKQAPVSNPLSQLE